MDHFDIALQLNRGTRQHARDIRIVARDNAALAKAQSIPLEQLQSNISNLCNSVFYVTQTAANWMGVNPGHAAKAAALMGVTPQDVIDYMRPLTDSAAALKAADLSSYAACAIALESFLALVPEPLTIYGT